MNKSLGQSQQMQQLNYSYDKQPEHANRSKDITRLNEYDFGNLWSINMCKSRDAIEIAT